MLTEMNLGEQTTFKRCIIDTADAYERVMEQHLALPAKVQKDGPHWNTWNQQNKTKDWTNKNYDKKYAKRFKKFI